MLTLKPAADNVWTQGIERMYCLVAHGEGNFFYPYNPNNSLEDIAGITSADGKVLGLMPHPDRAMEFTILYDWPLRREQMRRAGVAVPPESMNMQLFRNIVEYFR